MTVSTKLPASICPNCLADLDVATSAGNAIPKPGDAMICFYCLHSLILADDLTLREPTRREARQIANSKKMARMLQAWRDAHGTQH